MNKIADLLRRFEFQLLVFFAALVAFARPSLLPRSEVGAAAVWLAYFVPWAVVVVVLFCIARATAKAAPPPDAQARREPE
jgi:hypothetical protein